MLVTRKINVLSFIIGKPQAASNVKARSASKAQNLNDSNIEGLEKRIRITKSEDLYKAHATNVINPLSQLNR
jgi:hypothetical protein